MGRPVPAGLRLAGQPDRLRLLLGQDRARKQEHTDTFLDARWAGPGRGGQEGQGQRKRQEGGKEVIAAASLDRLARLLPNELTGLPAGCFGVTVMMNEP